MNLYKEGNKYKKELEKSLNEINKKYENISDREDNEEEEIILLESEFSNSGKMLESEKESM